MKRAARHGTLAAAVSAILAVNALLAPTGRTLDWLSLSSAWICSGLFCAVLLVGPLRARRGRRPPGNDPLRRDLGIWTALCGLLHLYLGTEQSMNTSYLAAFVSGTTLPPTPALRQALFSWGSIAGFAVGVLFLLLLGLSNDASIRLLGTRWWKRLQRASYIAFVLTVAHGIAFQTLENRATVWIALLVLAAATVVTLRWRAR